jgi:tetratricopeptide (TPR) repeat protein
MDFEILPQLIIILSVAGILVIIGKNFSKIKELEREEIFLQDVEEQEEKEKFLYLYKRAIRRFINKENYEQKVTTFWLWTEKALRKTRIAFLKLDAKIVSMLQNLRQKNVEAVEKIKEAEEAMQEDVSEKLAVVETEVANSESEYDASEKIVEDKVSAKDLAQETFQAFEPEVRGVGEKNEDVKKSEMVGEKEVEEKTANVIKATEDDQEEDLEAKKVRTKKEQEYISALMQDPRDIKSYWKLGIIYSRRRNYEDALACFRQIIKIDPTYTKAKQKAIELMEKMRGHGGNGE